MAAIASSGDELIRHPTIRPVAIITTIDSALMNRSPLVRPTSTADGLIGSVRKRSMMPSLRSCAIAEPEMVEPNTMVWAKMPAMMNS